MKGGLKLSGVLALCTLLALCFAGCGKKGTDDDWEQDIIGGDIGLYRLTLSGASTEIGLITVPFLKDDNYFPFLSISCDFNGDGDMLDYSANGDTQEELIVKDVPIRPTETEYGFYFALVDTGVASGSNVKVRVLINQFLVYPPNTIAKTPPLTGVGLEKTVAVQLLDVEDNANPADGYVGFGRYSMKRMTGGGANIQNPPRDDIDETSFFYRPDMPNAPQGPNTCVSHSMANSLAWLARKHAFTDSFSTPANEGLDPYDINTEQGVYELGWDLNTTYENRGSYTPATGVKKEHILAGKKEFVDQKKLPVRTTRMPSDTTDFSGKGVFESIKKALRDGCDVEVTFYVPDKKILHQVTAAGFADLEFQDTPPYRTLVVHDPNTQSYDDLYEIKEDSATFDKFPIAGGLHTARIAFAVKECYISPEAACADFSGTYDFVINDMDDPGGHYQQIGNPFEQPVVFYIDDPQLSADGQSPFVDANGLIDGECDFTANGSGTVAGIPNVRVEMTGRFADGSVSGAYAMGTEGRLPGGEAVTFYFTGYVQE